MTPTDFREARKAGGYTQKGLAAALRMGKHGWQTISKWESDNFDGDIPGPVQVAMEHLLNCGTKAVEEGWDMLPDKPGGRIAAIAAPYRASDPVAEALKDVLIALGVGPDECIASKWNAGVAKFRAFIEGETI